MPEQNKKLASIKQPEIWTARLSDLREYRQELLPLLNSAEHTRCARYLQQDDRNRYLGGRALTKLATAKLTGLQPADINIVVAASGKPAISLTRTDLKPPTISISHAGELVVVVLAHDVDIGVDVELLHHDVNLDELMGVVCSAREIAEINKPDQKQDQKSRTQKFYEFWVLKEAYLKATGDGLSADARHLVFSVCDASKVSLLQGMDNNPAHAWDFFLRQYDQQHVLALASRRIVYEQTDESKHTPAHCIPVFMDTLSLFREYFSGRMSE